MFQWRMLVPTRWLGLLLGVLALSCRSKNEGGAHEPATTAGSGGMTAGAATGGATAGESAGGSSSIGGAGASGGGQSGSLSGGAGSGAGSDVGGGGSGGVVKCPFTSDEYQLWEGTPPGDTGAVIEETTMERSTDPNVKDRAVAGVSRPSLLPYLSSKPGGAAAVIIPGGGYSYITVDKEGIDIAEWLNEHGISGFVLKYRLPTPFPGKPWIPLADAQRALRTIRAHASACNIDAESIGVVGFSAGGHLASQLVTRHAAQAAPALDAIDAVDARPSFGVLMYPVISMDPTIAHAGSRSNLLGDAPTAELQALYSSELQVTAQTPPCFVATSKKDTAVKPANSERFSAALTTAGVSGELELYEDGAHGTGIRNATGDMAAWPDHCATWLTTQGFIDP